MIEKDSLVATSEIPVVLPDGKPGSMRALTPADRSGLQRAHPGPVPPLAPDPERLGGARVPNELDAGYRAARSAWNGEQRLLQVMACLGYRTASGKEWSRDHLHQGTDDQRRRADDGRTAWARDTIADLAEDISDEWVYTASEALFGSDGFSAALAASGKGGSGTPAGPKPPKDASSGAG
jgi:hypothetical protein